jgi:uncharacterized protein YfdQ (DUF2303 family)
MISTVLAVMLAAAAPGPADKIAVARKEYTRCLKAFMDKSVKDKTEVSTFKAALATTCADKEQAFRSAVVAADVAAGIKRAAAEETAKTDVEDIRLNTSETYEGILNPQ